MNCAICNNESVTTCRPYDDFETAKFGLFAGGEGVLLCAECTELWEWRYFGTLAGKLFQYHRGVFRGMRVEMADLYTLLGMFNVVTKAKLN